MTIPHESIWLDSNRMCHGICVGGPLNGEVITHDSPVYKIRMWQDMRPRDYTNGNQACKATVKIAVYEFDGRGAWNFRKLGG